MSGDESYRSSSGAADEAGASLSSISILMCAFGFGLDGVDFSAAFDAAPAADFVASEAEAAASDEVATGAGAAAAAEPAPDFDTFFDRCLVPLTAGRFKASISCLVDGMTTSPPPAAAAPDCFRRDGVEAAAAAADPLPPDAAAPPLPLPLPLPFDCFDFDLDDL